MEKKTTGASCPWNLSTVPTRTSSDPSERDGIACEKL
jgi:hypothetical protein